jgi:hypothetical protein
MQAELILASTLSALAIIKVRSAISSSFKIAVNWKRPIFQEKTGRNGQYLSISIAD